jgi:hypothetical protein
LKVPHVSLIDFLGELLLLLRKTDKFSVLLGDSAFFKSVETHDVFSGLFLANRERGCRDHRQIFTGGRKLQPMTCQNQHYGATAPRLRSLENYNIILHCKFSSLHVALEQDGNHEQVKGVVSCGLSCASDITSPGNSGIVTCRRLDMYDRALQKKDSDLRSYMKMNSQAPMSLSFHIAK